MNNLHIHQMDITNAFPNALLKENIYMSAIPGYPLGSNKVLKLNKALYGLKQSPKEWNTLMNDFIISLKFLQCNDDKCIYMLKYNNDKDMIYIGLYVDDIIIAGSNITVINRIKKQIADRFACKDMGEIGQYLGIQITRNRNNKSLTITMKQYIDKMLFTFGMSECNTRSSPIEYKCIPTYDMCPTEHDDI